MPKAKTQQPDVTLRTVATDTPLQAGTIVYRVIEIDPPGPGLHTWEAVAVVVARASDKQIKLRRAFPGLDRTVFEPTAFGRLFFETAQQAIQRFLNEQRRMIETLDSKRKAAERALVWASSQEGIIYEVDP